MERKLNEYIDRDLTEGLVYEWTNSTEQIHDRYSDEEIKTLWAKLYEINNVDIILIMIYTGLRPTELLEILTENVHLEEKYMIGGIKTDAGKDRIIPLNDKIIPLIKKYLLQKEKSYFAKIAGYTYDAETHSSLHSYSA